jgi:uncharacterized protein YhdP
MESGGAAVPYGTIAADLALQGQVLTAKDLKAAAFGGTVSGSGQADLGAAGGPNYRLHYQLDNVAADQLLRAAGVEPQLSGSLTARGDISARGSTREALQATAKASCELVLTDGVLSAVHVAGAKRVDELPFERVRVDLVYAGKKLELNTFNMEALGGVLAVGGSADFNSPGNPGYRLELQLTNVDAAAFFHTFSDTKEITGRLTLKSGMTARGSSVEALQKTARGEFTLHLEKGVIKRYGVISSVLSFLNVSQLLDFRLPDLMTTGMPYQSIDGTYAVKDGLVNTTDLTMLSPAIMMTVVGDADLVNRNLDLKVGVQPFQGFGRIISRIPVIGWILTGRKKSVLVFYFDVKGRFEDPTITSISSSSLPKGVYNIFKRVLNLPEQLVTDPMKVIMD